MFRIYTASFWAGTAVARSCAWSIVRDATAFDDMYLKKRSKRRTDNLSCRPKYKWLLVHCFTWGCSGRYTSRLKRGMLGIYTRIMFCIYIVKILRRRDCIVPGGSFRIGTLCAPVETWEASVWQSCFSFTLWSFWEGGAVPSLYVWSPLMQALSQV